MVYKMQQIDFLADLEKSVYERIGANEHGVFCNFETPINVTLKNRASAKTLIAFDGKYWHIATDIMLTNEGSSSYPSVHDRWKTYESAYNRARRRLLVSLGRIAKRDRDSYGAKKDAQHLLRIICK